MADRRIAAIVARVFPDDVARAECIAARESTGTVGRFDPAAQNGSQTGLFEIEQDVWDWQLRAGVYRRIVIQIVGRLDWRRMHEALYNARAARRIWLYEKRHGRDPWTPWSTRELCGA